MIFSYAIDIYGYGEYGLAHAKRMRGIKLAWRN